MNYLDYSMRSMLNKVDLYGITSNLVEEVTREGVDFEDLF